MKSRQRKKQEHKQKVRGRKAKKELKNTIHLDKSQILWWADLSEDSQVLQTLKNQ